MLFHIINTNLFPASIKGGNLSANRIVVLRIILKMRFVTIYRSPIKSDAPEKYLEFLYHWFFHYLQDFEGNSSVLHCASLLRIISRVISGRIKKMAAFSLRLNLAVEVNRPFLENEYGDRSFFYCCFEFSNKFLYVK